MASLRDTVLGEFRPDLTLYLDLPPAVGLARARARGELDRIEQESLAFLSEPAHVTLNWPPVMPVLKRLMPPNPLNKLVRR